MEKETSRDKSPKNTSLLPPLPTPHPLVKMNNISEQSFHEQKKN